MHTAPDNRETRRALTRRRHLETRTEPPRPWTHAAELAHLELSQLEPETDPHTCPYCGTDNEPLGTLGYIAHYACRACGLWYHAQMGAGHDA